MKSRIFMYLFIFSILLVLFQYMNSKSIIEDYDKKLTKAEARVEVYKDSLKASIDEIFELKRFSLEFNDDAMSYFEDQGYEISELVPFIHRPGRARTMAMKIRPAGGRRTPPGGWRGPCGRTASSTEPRGPRSAP